MLRLKGVPFENATIERYLCHESSEEEVLIEMDLAGVFFGCRMENITEAFMRSKVSPAAIAKTGSTVTGAAQKVIYTLQTVCA